MSGESVDVTMAVTHKILLGGDQLSQARAQTAVKNFNLLNSELNSCCVWMLL